MRLLIPVPPWAAELFPADPLMFQRIDFDGLAYQHIAMPLRVICSAQLERDNRRWMHVSCSRPNRLPSWEELRLVKDTFIGRDRKALQVLPPQAEYVNIHPHVLHLWSCLDGDGLPDFRWFGQI
jgi:hypothetical protein